MTFEEVKKIIVDTLDCEEEKVLPEASLIEDLEVDSLSLVELHMAFEESIGQKIPDEKLAQLSTVQNIADYLNSLSEQ